MVDTDIISRSKLLESLGEEPKNTHDSDIELEAICSYRWFKKLVDDAEPVVREHAHWIHEGASHNGKSYLSSACRCSNCNIRVLYPSKFCPDCGLPMIDESD